MVQGEVLERGRRAVAATQRVQEGNDVVAGKAALHEAQRGEVVKAEPVVFHFT